MIEKEISKALDVMEKECGEDTGCLYCSNWFYPCGYREVIRVAKELGAKYVWNSNEGNSLISFAPTRLYDLDGVEIEVGYSGWEVREKKGGNKMKQLKFSEKYIISHGYGVDLGDVGDISLPESICWDEEDGHFTATVTYSYKGWEFSDCELYVKPEIGRWGDVELAEDVFDRYWEEWTIEPSEKTIVIEKGEKGALKGTNFEEFEEYYED